MNLQEIHINALDKAESMMDAKVIERYLNLKRLLADSSSRARHEFRKIFTHYYGLNAGGLTDQFKDKFFEILHSGKVFKNGEPRFHAILITLSKIKRKKGDFAMPFSFVSKLIGIHQESSPIYDRHVLKFFEVRIPPVSLSRSARIEQYVILLDRIAADYANWAKDPRVIPILRRLKQRDSRLAACHDVRLIDFLVWKVGNKKLL